jgi:hypothetical protein
MRFFSKITFVCNCCFVAAVILRWVENANKQKADFSGAIKLQPLESTLVVLGYGAIFVNLLFLITYLVVKFFTKKPVIVQQQTSIPIALKQVIPRWLIWINFLFFITQIYYFFFTS